MVPQEVSRTPKELNEFANSLSRSLGKMCGNGFLSVWDNGRRNRKLDQAEFIDMSPLSEDSRFNVEAHSFKR